jgi:hypothetical protein
MAATVQATTFPGKIFSVTGDSSYATGGYALAASDLPIRTCVGLNTGTVIALWDAPNKKVKFITAATGAEVANASDQSAVTVQLLVRF